MKRLTSTLGYTAAGLTIVAAILIPFWLMNAFTRGVAATGVRVDPVYAGGAPLRTIDKGGYRVVVHRAVERPTPLARIDSFVQLDWTPATALPARVSDEVDLDGDGRPDLRATFDVPRDPNAELRVDVAPLASGVRAMNGVGKQSFSCLIARVGDAIVVRVPLAGK
jgi:hypothetical protein